MCTQRFDDYLRKNGTSPATLNAHTVDGAIDTYLLTIPEDGVKVSKSRGYARSKLTHLANFIKYGTVDIQSRVPPARLAHTFDAASQHKFDDFCTVLKNSRASRDTQNPIKQHTRLFDAYLRKNEASLATLLPGTVDGTIKTYLLTLPELGPGVKKTESRGYAKTQLTHLASSIKHGTVTIQSKAPPAMRTHTFDAVSQAVFEEFRTTLDVSEGRLTRSTRLFDKHLQKNGESLATLLTTGTVDDAINTYIGTLEEGDTRVPGSQGQEGMHLKHLAVFMRTDAARLAAARATALLAAVKIEEEEEAGLVRPNVEQVTRIERKQLNTAQTRYTTTIETIDYTMFVEDDNGDIKPSTVTAIVDTLTVSGRQTYDANLEKMFPIRDPAHPGQVHPDYAHPDDPTRCSPNVRFEDVSFLEAGSDMLNEEELWRVARKNFGKKPPFRLKAHFFEALKRSCQEELEATIRNTMPPSCDRVEVVEVRPEHCDNEAEVAALVGDKKYGVVLKDYAADKQPSLRNGRIVCIFSGAKLGSAKDVDTYRNALGNEFGFAQKALDGKRPTAPS